MAPGPTDLEAWTALQAFTSELDQVRRPKELKEAMHQCVSRSWDMSESKLDFVDFGVVWFDDHYRRICNKFSEIGPGRETFNMATYRTLKTSRLDGYWDVMLEDLADWIESFTQGSRRNLTLNDYERLIACMPKDRNLQFWEQNVKELFWSGPGYDRRSVDFMTQFTPSAYGDAYTRLLKNPPQDCWNLRTIMAQIHDKGLMCKSVMLHVSFWFNPYLEEPANRANIKPPMFHHLKPSFSKYNPYDLRYPDDDSWVAPALSLQRVVLNYTLEWFPKSNAVVGNLGMLRDMSQSKYSDYVNTYFWSRLISEVRNHTDVPFQHISLVKFKTLNDIPLVGTGLILEDRAPSLRSQVSNIIQEEYSDRQSLDTEDERETFDGEHANSALHGDGRDGTRNAQPTSITPEAPAVESDGDQDIMHVKTPSPSTSNPLKKRKVHHRDEGSGHASVSDNQYAVPRAAARKIVTLQVPSQNGQNGTAAQSEVDGQSGHLVRTRPLMHAVLASQDAHTNRDLLSNGVHPVAQPPQWTHIEQETAQRALAHYEGNLRLKSARPPSPERRQSMPALQTYQPLKNTFPMVTSQSTPSPHPPIASPAPQATPQPPTVAQTQIAVSPALMRNKTEQAIMVLQNEYEGRMQIEEMLAVINFFKNDLEAGIFLTLKPGTLRDAWLRDGMKQSSMI